MHEYPATYNEAVESEESTGYVDETRSPVESQTEIDDNPPMIEAVETDVREVKVSTILEMLERGYTRTPKNKEYDPNIGSIMEHFNLTAGQTALLFKHPSLKGKRTKVTTLPFTLTDDTNQNE